MKWKPKGISALSYIKKKKNSKSLCFKYIGIKYINILHYSLYFSASQTFQKFILRLQYVNEV